ncbi:MAG: hypothetical protein WCF48_07010 [Terriglobales bacterium]
MRVEISGRRPRRATALSFRETASRWELAASAAADGGCAAGQSQPDGQKQSKYHARAYSDALEKVEKYAAEFH